jgi:hypothetical protein
MTPDRQNRLITDIESEFINCLFKCPKIDDPWNSDILTMSSTKDTDVNNYNTESDRSQSFFLNLYG